MVSACRFRVGARRVHRDRFRAAGGPAGTVVLSCHPTCGPHHDGRIARIICVPTPLRSSGRTSARGQRKSCGGAVGGRRGYPSQPRRCAPALRLHAPPAGGATDNEEGAGRRSIGRLRSVTRFASGSHCRTPAAVRSRRPDGGQSCREGYRVIPLPYLAAIAHFPTRVSAKALSCSTVLLPAKDGSVQRLWSE